MKLKSPLIKLRLSKSHTLHQGEQYLESGYVYAPYIPLMMDQLTIRANERALRATWTPELAQDLAAYHNIDAEDELTRLLQEQLTEQLAEAIDQEIINDLRNLNTVPVQPMPMPNGNLFYMDFTYDTWVDYTFYDDGVVKGKLQRLKIT
jgi:hypothetical protein